VKKALTSSKQLKICIYWKDKSCNSFSHFWIGSSGKSGKGIADRPSFMVKLFLEFVWRRGWITPGETAAYIIVRDKNVVLEQLKEKGISSNGNEL